MAQALPGLHEVRSTDVVVSHIVKRRPRLFQPTLIMSERTIMSDSSGIAGNSAMQRVLVALSLASWSSTLDRRVSK